MTAKSTLTKKEDIISTQTKGTLEEFQWKDTDNHSQYYCNATVLSFTCIVWIVANEGLQGFPTKHVMINLGDWHPGWGVD